MAHDGPDRHKSESAKARPLVIFLAGSVGGVALDILTLYVRGFPTPDGHTSLQVWVAGVVLRVALFMALTGFLAILYSDGRLRNAFVIGVAAPSILLNIAASFRPANPGEQPNTAMTAPGQATPVPAIPSIPLPSQPGGPAPTIPSRPIPGHSTRSSWWFPSIGPAKAEAQTRAVSQAASYGQVQVNLDLPEEWITKSPGYLKIHDANTGKLIATTTPPSSNFAFLLPRGTYNLTYEGEAGRSDPQKIDVRPGQVNAVKLSINAKLIPKEGKKPSTASDLWRGATDRLDGVSQIKERANLLK